MEAAFNLLALGLVGYGLFYFLATVGSGLVQMRRLGSAQGWPRHTFPDPRTAEPAETGLHPASGDYYVWFLVPCLNEEAVIPDTVRCLASNPGVRVLVVDDGSDDATAQAAEAAGGTQTRVVRRVMPEARQGKGAALNAGYRVLCEEVAAAGVDPDRVLVGVMDADGRLSNGAVDHVCELFDDPEVGGAQLMVRIRNRSNALIATLQDFEFWGVSAVAQVGRRATQTVSLGGNGQFTRLSRLQELPHAPWNAGLTEDLELAVTLTLAGCRLTTTPHAAVDQQGLERFDQLLRQRARWYQGHMMACSRLRDVWNSPKLKHSAALEMSLYLLIPWLQVLPWSIVFHVALLRAAGNFAPPDVELLGSPILGQGAVLGAFYVFSFAPYLLAGYLYFRQDRRMGRVRSFLLGHMLLPWIYVSFVACWRGLGQLLRGQNEWDKTVRVLESVDSSAPTARARIRV